MIPIVLGGAALLTAGALGVASTRPKSFRLNRQRRINARPDAIYPWLADYRNWTGWSPFEQLEGDIKRSYSGPSEGVGARYAWEGTGKAGAGSMEMQRVERERLLEFSLIFTRPFKANNTGRFELQPDGDATVVSWTMEGPSPLISRVMGLFMDFDKLVGRDFEKGLASLARLAESGQRPGETQSQRSSSASAH